ncbi:unnamed protein product, partial [Heterotrigona itama]
FNHGKRNNMIPNEYFHKDWQRFLKLGLTNQVENIVMNKVPKKGDATEEEMKLAMQVKGEIMPIRHQAQVEAKAHVISEDEKKFFVYTSLCNAQVDAKLVGIRAKRVKDVAENRMKLLKKNQMRLLKKIKK